MKMIKIIISGIFGFLGGFFAAYKLVLKSSNKWKEMSNKHLAIMLLFNQWMIAKKSGGSIAEYLENQGYQRVIIYGMSYVGQRLLEELTDSEIEIVAAMDKNADILNSAVPILAPQDEVPNTDCIIVTAIYHYSEIKEMLSYRVQCPILSLESVLYEI